MAESTTPEDPNVEPDLPDSGIANSELIERELHSTQSEYYNQSEDGSSMEEESMGKSQLSQVNDYLDDPSQFYFDDDLPTPELSSASNDNSCEATMLGLDEDGNNPIEGGGGDEKVLMDEEGEEEEDKESLDEEIEEGGEDQIEDNASFEPNHSSNLSVESEHTYDEDNLNQENVRKEKQDETRESEESNNEEEEEGGESDKSDDEHFKEDGEMEEEGEEEEDDGSIIMDDYDEEGDEERDVSLEDYSKSQDSEEEGIEDANSRDSEEEEPGIEEDAASRDSEEEEDGIEDAKSRDSEEGDQEDEIEDAKSRDSEEEEDGIEDAKSRDSEEEVQEDEIEDAKSIESEEEEQGIEEANSRDSEEEEEQEDGIEDAKSRDSEEGEDGENVEDEEKNESDREEMEENGSKNDDIKEVLEDVVEDKSTKHIETSRGNAESEKEMEDKEVADDVVRESNVERTVATKRRRRRSIRSQNESKRVKFVKSEPVETGVVEIKSEPTIEIKLEASCAGLLVTKSDLEQIKLKKDLLQCRISTIDKFLNPDVKCKEWRVGEDMEEEKVSEIQRRTRQSRTESDQRVGAKRKRSEDVEPVKKDGRGRPKGFRIKKEVAAESVEVKPIPKRRKKDEMLLMKALDEEMFKMDEESNKELERISQGLDYQCSVCSQVFIEKINLSKHFFKCLMKFTQSGRSSFKCAICFEYFSLLESLETHVERKHDGICEEPFQCSQCSLCFDRGSCLKAHVLETHDVFQCVYCEKYYRNQHTLDVHVGKKHAAEVVNAKARVKVENEARVKVETSVAVKVESAPVQVKIEPVPIPAISIASTAEGRVKKLGRPLKRKATDDPTAPEPVKPLKRKLSDDTLVVKTEPIDPCRTPEMTSGGEEHGLGRGRRLKKKKQLDYEDSISTMSGRKVRKSLDTAAVGGEQTDLPTVNDIKQEIERIKSELEEISPGQYVKVQSKVLPQPKVLCEILPEPGALPQSRLLHQPRILPQSRPQPRPLNQSLWKDSPAFQKKEIFVVKCSQSTNTPECIATITPLLNVSQTIDEVIGNGHTGGGTEQPVETRVYLNRKVHLCPKCRKPFPNKFLVKLHMKRRHNIFKRKTVIAPSNGEVTGEEESTGHRSMQNGFGRTRSRPSAWNRESLFKCSLCDASFATFYSLEEHYLNIHQGIPCGVCKISIKNRILLDKHLNTCHLPQERYVCPVCDKCMKSKETLRKHIVMHEDRRPYDCVVCKRSFRYTYDMRLHMRRTHPKEWQSFVKTDSGEGGEDVMGVVGESQCEMTT